MSKNTAGMFAALKSIQDYAKSKGVVPEEEKNQALLDELNIALTATDIISLLSDEQRLKEAVAKLKLKVFL